MGFGRAMGSRGLLQKRAQTARAEGQDERGNAAGLQPLEIGAGFGPGKRKEKTVEMLDGEAALKAAGVARLGLPSSAREKGGRASDIVQAGPWVTWEGEGKPQLPSQDRLGGEPPLRQAGLRVERRTRYG